MKKVLALMIAALMIVVSMSAITAFADTFTWDTSIKVTGLDAGDKVNLYQVITRNATSGAWEIDSDFAALTTTGNANFSQNVADIVASKSGAALTEDDIAKIVAVAKTKTPDDTKTLGTGETEYTHNTTSAPGMYLALVEPTNPDTVYNPIIVSADYTQGNNEIDASSALLLNAMAKKDTVTLTKDTEDVTLDVGEPVLFTIRTVIPVFADSYTNPFFNLTDTMQAGLALVKDDAHPFTINAGDVTVPAADIPADGATGSFTLHFDSAKIAALTAPQAVTITYYAKITDTSALTNIVEKYNDVEVVFSNNPKDDTGHGHKYDEVREYTFSIDANIFGNSSYRSGEIVKVGVDGQGDPILSEKTLSNGSSHSALEGAKFKLYKTQAGAQNETSADEYHNPAYDASLQNGYIVSDANGLMYIPGLDEGTYWIKEIQAPQGWIRDTQAHSITIEATHGKQTFTKTFDDCNKTVSYDVDIVTSYTVKFDGGNTSTYSWTNQGPEVSSITIGDSSSEIRNTKGLELPSTGGVGTTIFYVGGSILVVLAVIFLVTKRRMSAND